VIVSDIYSPKLFLFIIVCKSAVYIDKMLRNIFKACNLFSFSNEVAKTAAKSTTATSGLTYYKDGQLVNRTAITLKKQEDIESYVIKTVQNYFRTTYKQGTDFIT